MSDPEPWLGTTPLQPVVLLPRLQGTLVSQIISVDPACVICTRHCARRRACRRAGRGRPRSRGLPLCGGPGRKAAVTVRQWHGQGVQAHAWVREIAVRLSGPPLGACTGAGVAACQPGSAGLGLCCGPPAHLCGVVVWDSLRPAYPLEESEQMQRQGGGEGFSSLRHPLSGPQCPLG